MAIDKNLLKLSTERTLRRLAKERRDELDIDAQFGILEGTQVSSGAVEPNTRTVSYSPNFFDGPDSILSLPPNIFISQVQLERYPWVGIIDDIIDHIYEDFLRLNLPFTITVTETHIDKFLFTAIEDGDENLWYLSGYNSVTGELQIWSRIRRGSFTLVLQTTIAGAMYRASTGWSNTGGRFVSINEDSSPTGGWPGAASTAEAQETLQAWPLGGRTRGRQTTRVGTETIGNTNPDAPGTFPLRVTGGGILDTLGIQENLRNGLLDNVAYRLGFRSYKEEINIFNSLQNTFTPIITGQYMSIAAEFETGSISSSFDEQNTTFDGPISVSIGSSIDGPFAFQLDPNVVVNGASVTTYPLHGFVVSDARQVKFTATETQDRANFGPKQYRLAAYDPMADRFSDPLVISNGVPAQNYQVSVVDALPTTPGDMVTLQIISGATPAANYQQTKVYSQVNTNSIEINWSFTQDQNGNTGISTVGEFLTEFLALPSDRVGFDGVDGFGRDGTPSVVVELFSGAAIEDAPEIGQSNYIALSNGNTPPFQFPFLDRPIFGIASESGIVLGGDPSTPVFLAFNYVIDQSTPAPVTRYDFTANPLFTVEIFQSTQWVMVANGNRYILDPSSSNFPFVADLTDVTTQPTIENLTWQGQQMTLQLLSVEPVDWDAIAGETADIPTGEVRLYSGNAPLLLDPDFCSLHYGGQGFEFTIAGGGPAPF